jgi:hypothetical protein
MRRPALVLGVCALAAALAGVAGAGKPQAIAVSPVVDVSRDQTAQNETPIAVNPGNPANMVVGANDWNPNDGCAVSATRDGGKTWTPTLPSGFVPGVTRTTNDPSVPGTGAYEVAGDPSVGFGPDGTAYFSCLAYNLSSPFQGAILVSKSSDGGFRWQPGGLSQVTTFTGNGKTKGSNGQAADHDDLHVDPTNGYVYVSWSEFHGGGSNSPTYVAVSHDRAATWKVTKVASGPVRANQDQRVVTDAAGNAYLVFDNGVQGGKGTVLDVSKSTDGGLTWSAPVQFAALTNPVCLFPPDCFDISGSPFRAPGSYPAPAFDNVRNRLDVVVADIRGTYAGIELYSLKPDLTLDFQTEIPGATGDRFGGELSTAPNGRLDVSFYDRGYSGNSLVDLTYATSADGGHTWRQARVSSAGFDPAQWGVPGDTTPRPFIGDYNGIASTATTAVMSWTGVAPPQPFNLEIDFATATP